jgi:ABC-2 type transport system ATP-binding protein
MFDVDIDNLSKYFGAFCAVDRMTFGVKHGEVFGLLGPNGAGKSTLIRMLVTLVVPSSGHARVNGFDVAREANQVRKSIGVIPQAMTSDLDLTAVENMTIFAKLYGLSPQKRKTAIHDLLKAVDLLDWADKQVKTFSGGMRRRLEIARGLVHEPRIFILDEPTTGLDPVSRVAVWEMLDRLRRERDLTVMLSTHYMDEADKLCDRVAIVDHGKLVALDSPLKLKTSIPGTNTVEVSFSSIPSDWQRTLESLPDVAAVKADDGVFRLSSNNGPRTVVALMDAVHAARISVASLSVQSTTLDDVFVHYTGRQLRDAVHKPNPAESRFVIRR